MEVITTTLRLPPAYEPLLYAYRYKMLYGGRGGGKSWAFADCLLILGLNRKMRFMCAREFQVSIADSVHRLLSDRIEALGLSYHYEIQKTTIIGANGTEFLFKGLKHNITEIKSLEGVDIAWVEEAEKVSQASWETLIPTIRKEGSEIWISMNTKHATDASYRRFVFNPPKDSYVAKVSWRDNPFFPAVLERERLDMLERDPEAYQHIWEGEFDTRYSGAVYAKLLAQYRDHQSDRVKYDPQYPVYTCWDLGYDDATAIWFYQIAPKELLFIDYYEYNLEGIEHYCNILKAKPYRYHSHYVPHDAAHKIQAAHGKSIMEQARELGVKMTMLPATSQQNGINAVRKVLPVCWFNSTACADGLEAMMYYHFEYSEDLGRFKSAPLHDWSSHACKAIELACRVYADRVTTTKEMDIKEIRNTFFRKRRENNLDSQDPYRIKPRI